MQRENEIMEVSKDSTAKSLWNSIKRKACWSSSQAPTMLRVSDTEYTSSPEKMASALNNYFVEKVKNICSNL